MSRVLQLAQRARSLVCAPRTPLASCPYLRACTPSLVRVSVRGMGTQEGSTEYAPLAENTAKGVPDSSNSIAIATSVFNNAWQRIEKKYGRNNLYVCAV